MKRIFDVIVAGLGLLFLFPVFIIVSMLIVADSKGGFFLGSIELGDLGKILGYINLERCLSIQKKRTDNSWSRCSGNQSWMVFTEVQNR